MIWTTTPWTLPANLGIAVHPDFEYVAVESGADVYIVAGELLEAVATKCQLESPKVLARFRGVEIDTARDGFFASFDGPARAVHCAAAIVEAVRPLGLEVRAGVHTGEVERIGDKIGGLTVNIGARVAALAGPSEVAVSQTVRDLMVGSELVFHDRGARMLKGVPGEWRVYTVERSRAGAGS